MACLTLARDACVVDGLDFRRRQGATENLDFVDQTIKKIRGENNVPPDLEVGSRRGVH